PTFSGNSAGNASTTLTNPQDNINVYGTLLVDTGATLTATGGSGQSTTINTAFGQALQGTLLDGSNNPIPPPAITFPLPASTGASAPFPNGLPSGSLVFITSNNGQVNVAASANGNTGGYSVGASAGPLSTSFSLTNNSATPQATVSKIDDGLTSQRSMVR